MKNLKRLLSLALTGVMLSGMMVMGASAADFTDADEIVNTEAVDTMVALNIINGKDTGDFDPEGLVTRAEMAKMIATAVNGGVAPTFGVKTVPTYSDTKGHWAEQFIEYCSDMKYINGRGNGTFDPNGNVTGTEAAKMVLTALGYETRAYQLTGADWAINTNALAIRDCKPSLYENLNGVSMNMPITRDSAAQLIWNGVQNYIVEYNPNVTITGTDITYGYEKSTTTTLLKLAYDANISSGMFNGNSKVVTSLKDGQLQVKVDTENGTAVTPAPKTITADLDISYIGENVKIIWKDEKNTTRGLDAKDKIYGVFPTGETEVVHATVNDISTTHTTTGEVKIDGTVYKCVAAAATTDVVVDKNYGAGSVTATAASDEGVAAAVRSIAAQAGSPIKIILNDDGKIEKVYLVESKLATVTAKTSEKITLSNMGTIKIEDNDVYEDIAKNDVVVATVLYKTAATATGAYTIVEKAEKVSGEITGFTENVAGTSTSKIVLDGETYKVVGKAAMPTNVGGETAESNIDKSDIGADFDLYLVNGYVAAAIKTTETANNYSLVMEVRSDSTTSSAFDKLQLYVMDGEGTKSVITVSDSSSLKSHSDYAAGDLITYTINNKGEAVVTLEKDYSDATAGNGAGDAATANTQYNKDTKSFGESNGAKAVTAGNAVIFAEVKSGKDFTDTTGTEFKVYNIRDLNTFNVPTGNKYSVQKDSDGKIVAIVANLNSTPAGATVNVEIGMVVAADGVVKIDGTAYNTYKVWNGEEELKVNIVKDATNGDTLTTGTIYSFIRTNDDTYSDDDAFTVVKGGISAVGATNALTLDGTAHTVVAWAIKDYNEADKLLTGYNTVTGNDTIGYTGGGVDTYAVDDDVKIIYVNTKDNKAGESIGVNAFDATTGKVNALVISKDGGKVKYIVVETSGKENIWE